MDAWIAITVIGLIILYGLSYAYLRTIVLAKRRNQVDDDLLSLFKRQADLEFRVQVEISHRQSLRSRVLNLSKQVARLTDGLSSAQVPDPIDWTRVLDRGYPLETLQAIARSFEDLETVRARALAGSPDRYLLTELLPCLGGELNTGSQSCLDSSGKTRWYSNKWIQTMERSSPLGTMVQEMDKRLRAKTESKYMYSGCAGADLVKEVYADLIAEIEADA